jgi:hypothetical protein
LADARRGGGRRSSSDPTYAAPRRWALAFVVRPRLLRGAHQPPPPRAPA